MEASQPSIYKEYNEKKEEKKRFVQRASTIDRLEYVTVSSKWVQQNALSASISVTSIYWILKQSYSG